MKRRDLLEAAKLLVRHKMDQTNVAALMLATQYLAQKNDGETTLGFQEWLDQEPTSDDDEDLEEDLPPTPPQTRD